MILSAFERKAITRKYPRPGVDYVYTPTLDNYLPSLLPGVKTVDKDNIFFQVRCTLHKVFSLLRRDLSSNANEINADSLAFRLTSASWSNTHHEHRSTNSRYLEGGLSSTMRWVMKNRSASQSLCSSVTPVLLNVRDPFNTKLALVLIRVLL